MYFQRLLGSKSHSLHRISLKLKYTKAYSVLSSGIKWWKCKITDSQSLVRVADFLLLSLACEVGRRELWTWCLLSGWELKVKLCLPHHFSLVAQCQIVEGSLWLSEHLCHGGITDVISLWFLSGITLKALSAALYCFAPWSCVGWLVVCPVFRNLLLCLLFCWSSLLVSSSLVVHISVNVTWFATTHFNAVK